MFSVNPFVGTNFSKDAPKDPDWAGFKLVVRGWATGKTGSDKWVTGLLKNWETFVGSILGSSGINLSTSGGYEIELIKELRVC